MTIGEGIARVKTLYNKGPASNNSRLSSRHIYSVIKSLRTLLLKREADKKKVLSDWDISVLPCVEMIEAPKHECPCIPIQGCTILRSKYTLPKPILLNKGDLITSVSSIDNSQSWDKSSWEMEQKRKGNKYTSSTPAYYIRNNYLYLVNVQFLEVVTVSGVFEDPTEVSKFKGLCDSSTGITGICENYLDLDLQIDSHLEQPLIESCFKELLDLMSRGTEDYETNTRDPKTSNYIE